MDLALANDIDMEQYKFFEEIAKNRVGADGAVIIVTHEPMWTMDGMNPNIKTEDISEPNLRELMRTPLAGRVRARIAGDLHHYTRHTPNQQQQQQQQQSDNGSPANLPELIVSGGGGAFLHPTHVFENEIKVGVHQADYKRVSCYPDERISYRLSFLNILHFRWRNWRLDIVWGGMYFLLAYSLFPLCGLYSDFKEQNFVRGDRVLLEFPIWWLGKFVECMVNIAHHGFVSPLVIVVVLSSLYILCDECMEGKRRIVWGLTHGLVHIFCAISCCLFIELVTELAAEELFLGVGGRGRGRGAGADVAMSDSLMDEFETHFAGMFNTALETVNENLNLNSVVLLPPDTDFGRVGNMCRHVMEIVENLVKIPSVKHIYDVIDVPGTLVRTHEQICAAGRGGGGGVGGVDRFVVVSYFGSLALYYFVLAIPIAGFVFGGWLCITLNYFKAQHNEGFSSLRIQHWKNLLKCHVRSDGDLEIFAIGLDRR